MPEEFKRLDIKTGYVCNNWCRFCVQAHNRHFGNRTTDEIKKSLLEAKKAGARGVVFTGGEVTIRHDVFEIIDYAKRLGFEIIQLQSNGRRFADIEFVKKVMKLGVNEFGPSLHGHIPEIHDYLTRSPGAWRQTTQGIKNIKRLGGYIVLNSVVVKANYRYALEFAKLMVELKVDQFQYAFMHAVGNAWVNFNSMMAPAKEAAEYMKKGIRYAVEHGVMVMAEAMPFCLMKGYERYVSELYIPKTMIREKDFWIKDFEKIRKKEGKMRFDQCKQCRFLPICEGPWKEYPERMGQDEFQPVPGEWVYSKEDILNNPNEFPILPKEE